MGYYRNGFFTFAWDLDIIFLCIPNFPISKVKKNIRSFGSKDVVEICVGCFLVYSF